MRGANRNTILSHGGKHGNAAGTYLKGQPFTGESPEHVPEYLQTDVAHRQPGTQGSLPSGARKRVPTPTPVQTPASSDDRLGDLPETHLNPPKDEAQVPPSQPESAAVAPEATEAAQVPQPEPEAAEAAPTAPAEEDDPLAMPGDDAPAAEDEGLPEGASPAPDLPTSKRQLTRMAKADAYALALELGVEVPANPDDIKASELKAKLAAEIGL